MTRTRRNPTRLASARPWFVAAVATAVVAGCSSGGDATSASSGAAPSSLSSSQRAAVSDPAGRPSGSPADRVPATMQPVADGQLMSYVVNSTPDAIGKADTAIRSAGGTVIADWPQIGVVVVQSKRGKFRQELLTATSSDVVASVGATRTVPVRATSYPKPQVTSGDTSTPKATTSRDPRESSQWDMQQLGTSPGDEGSSSVRVGVLDGGIDQNHPDLKANFDAADSASCINGGRLDRDPQHWLPTSGGHGTHVAGTIAAARNGVGIAGVAPDVRVASVKVVDDNGLIYPEYAVCGFMWAGQRKLDVTNNSYFVDPWTYWCDDGADQQAAKEAVRRAVAWSQQQGVVSVAAAGNSSYDLANKKTDVESPDDSTPGRRTVDNDCQNIPTELSGVVTVSSTDRGGALSDFSNYGRGVIDVAAPGGQILSTWPGGGYQLLSGTSMASPHVAGVLALLKSKHRDASPDELVRLVRDQAVPHACGGSHCTGSADDNSDYGQGIVTAKVE